MDDEYLAALERQEKSADVQRRLAEHRRFVELRALDRSRSYPIDATFAFYSLARQLMERALLLDLAPPRYSGSEDNAFRAFSAALESALTVTLRELLDAPVSVRKWLAEYVIRAAPRCYSQAALLAINPVQGLYVFEAGGAQDAEFVERSALARAETQLRALSVRIAAATRRLERAFGVEPETLVDPQLPRGMGRNWPGYDTAPETIVDAYEQVDDWRRPRALAENATLFAVRLVVAGLVSDLYINDEMPRTIPVPRSDTAFALETREQGNPRPWRGYLSDDGSFEYRAYAALLRDKNFDEFLASRRQYAERDVRAMTRAYTTALDYVRELRAD